MSRRGLMPALLVALTSLTSIAWLDPHQAVRDANRLYAEGKYDDAAAAYNAALVDKPDSPDLHFNLGDATYKQGKYDEAVSAFQKVETTGDTTRASRVAYNVGNATFRQGQAVEQTEPQKALTLYAEALASYRRALGLDPNDQDTKFNHELVTKRIDDLKKKIEEQKKEQEQKQQDQKQDQQQKNDQQKDQAKDQQEQQQDEQQQQDQKQPSEQQDGGDQKDQPPKDEQDQKEGQPAEQQAEPSDDEQPSAEDKQNAQQPSEQAPSEQPQEQAGDATVGGEQKEGELSKGEAAAILDSQRGEEVSPEDIIKKLQGGRVAEPAQDW